MSPYNRHSKSIVLLIRVNNTESIIGQGDFLWDIYEERGRKK